MLRPTEHGVNHPRGGSFAAPAADTYVRSPSTRLHQFIPPWGHAGSSAAAGPPGAMVGTPAWMAAATRVIEATMNKDCAAPFNEPVTAEAFPGHPEVVGKPMGLREVLVRGIVCAPRAPGEFCVAVDSASLPFYRASYTRGSMRSQGKFSGM
eukprot:scaffold751_cov395-Prasinococcus_capsulatus_cf.AAC.25